MISQREKEDIGGAYYLDGHKAGLAEGKAEALLETARNLQEMGLSPEQIKQATGVTL